jgi:hypothetical protein
MLQRLPVSLDCRTRVSEVHRRNLSSTGGRIIAPNEKAGMNSGKIPGARRRAAGQGIEKTGVRFRKQKILGWSRFFRPRFTEADGSFFTKADGSFAPYDSRSKTMSCL